MKSTTAPKSAIVVGSGFAGLSAASYLAKDGWDVTVLEKNESIGGRARKFEVDGFTFDMGPSWYWMPDVFDKFFNDFGYQTADFYELIRLDPSYQVIFDTDTRWDIPADFESLCQLFEREEKGAAEKLKDFLNDAAYKYEVGINDLVYKPGVSLTEFIDTRIIKGVFKLELLSSISKSIRRRFKSKKLIELLEFPVLFLGAKPEQTPALYSLMNYADIKLGTWYPKGGMHKVVEAMMQVAKKQGVKLITNCEVQHAEVIDRSIKQLQTNQGSFSANIVVNGADYAHFEQDVLPPEARKYSTDYWQKKNHGTIVFVVLCWCK